MQTDLGVGAVKNDYINKQDSAAINSPDYKLYSPH